MTCFLWRLREEGGSAGVNSSVVWGNINCPLQFCCYSRPNYQRQTPTYYLKRHQTNLIVGWYPFMRRNYAMAVWSAVCRLISILLVKLPQVQYVIALPWKQCGRLIFLTRGVFSSLLHSSVGSKLESVVLLKKHLWSEISKPRPNIEILYFYVVFCGWEMSLLTYCGLTQNSGLYKYKQSQNNSLLPLTSW